MGAKEPKQWTKDVKDNGWVEVPVKVPDKVPTKVPILQPMPS